MGHRGALWKVVAPATLVISLALWLVPSMEVGADPTPGTAAEGSAPVPDWGQLEQQALVAAQSTRQSGPVSVDDSMTAASATYLTTPAGEQVPIQSRTVAVRDGSGQFVMSMSLVGGTQLVVGLTDTTAASSDTLVLVPGTSEVAAKEHSRAQVQTISSADSSATGVSRVSLNAGHRLPFGKGTDNAPIEMFTALPWGCMEASDNPVIIATIYGYFISGETDVWCPSAQNISIISSLYEWTGSQSKGIGNSGSGSGYTPALSEYAYAWCSYQSAQNWFQTASLFSIDGQLFGNTSYWQLLDCALD